jgi:hypothetical protein
MAILAKVLLRLNHSFALWAIPFLAAFAVIGWLLLVRVLQDPFMSAGRYRAYGVGAGVIVAVMCCAVLIME